MVIAIIDYRAGNLTSVKRALDSLYLRSFITDDPSEIIKADRIIFPGVGAAGSAMENLKESGIDEAIKEAFYRGKPILGICLGTQIIMEWSEEDNTRCLGLIPGTVKRFPEDMKDKDGKRLKVPHMGWNRIFMIRKHPLFEGIDPDHEFYFVHSYFPVPKERSYVIGETEYGIRFPSVIGYRNLFAVQFHPEKSGRPGLKILENFSRWDGDA